MARKTMNASRLQQEVSRRLQRLQEVVDEGVRIGVPRPQRRPPDAAGGNWTMKHFGNAAGFEAAIAGVLAQVRAEYDLADEAPEPAVPSREPTTRADPFGDAVPRRGAANPFGEATPRERADPFGGTPPRERGSAFGGAGAATEGEAAGGLTGDPFAPSGGERDADPPSTPPPRDPFRAD